MTPRSAPIKSRMTNQAAPFTLYTKLGCPWCVDAVDWLRARGYEFREVDVRREPAAMAEMKRVSGQSLAPTLVLADGTVLPDFDTRQLEAFLAKHGLLRT